MLISSRLKRSSSTSLIIFASVIFLLFWKYIELNEAKVDLSLANEIKANFFERTSYRDQYFLNREVRIQHQWETSKQESDALLRRAMKEFDDQTSLPLLEELRIEVESCANIFHRIVINSDQLAKFSATENTDEDAENIYHELDRRLYSQLLLKASTVRKTIDSLETNQLQRVEHSSNQLFLICIFSALALLLTALHNTISINKLIRRRLRPLHEGASAIAAGDLSVRIQSRGTDEFTDLAQAFNKVAATIQTKLTEEKKSEELLRVAAAAFETHDGIIITDSNNNTLRVNAAFQAISGYSEAEIIHKNPRFMNSGREGKEFFVAMWQQLINTGTWAGEIWNKHKDGTIYPKWLTITAIKNAAGETSQYVGILSDIADRKKAEQEIHHLAFYDMLTALPNRRLLLDRMRLALSTSARSKQYGAVLFLDMDKFKLLNDILGHDYGDLMLVEIARRIIMCVREVDTVSRIGGDEFVVLLEEMGEHPENATRSVAMIAEKIRATLSLPYYLNNTEYHSSPSIGVSLYLSNTESPDTILKHADVAMYQVKESGRNAVSFFDPAMQMAAEAKAALELDLRRALHKKSLELFYQLQLNSEHYPIGAEALVRWHHPTRGIIPPEDFIPIAEESSLIFDLGNWVLDAACRQLAIWSKDIQTRNLILAVNVSVRQFKHQDFVSQVSTALHLHGVDPSRLKLELTESVVFSDVTNVVSKMYSLMAIGIKLSMDDFGTGYSSLSYLKKLPLDQLKIDRSFIRDMNTDQNDVLMVKTIIDLAKNFHLNVIAEGVETEAQLSLLKELGCLNYQGFLFSRPLPVGQFEALLK